MKVIFLSESPTLTTGFARTTRIWAELLVESGHEVFCFGIGTWGKSPDKNQLKYELWQAGNFEDEHRIKFLELTHLINPDLIIINYDLITTLDWIDFLKANHVKTRIISYLIVDGLPVYPQILRSLNKIELVVTTTNIVKEFLVNHVTTPIVVFPHLVDENDFFSLPKIKTRKNALLNNQPLIGVFAANRPRKQITSTIQALKTLHKNGINCCLLVHTDYVNSTIRGGDNLDFISQYYSLSSHLFITDSNNKLPNSLSYYNRGLINGETQFFDTLSINEKINCCDVIVVASKFGGFEYNIIEAQSCQIPICLTNDGGIMKEVGGSGAHLLQPSMYEFTNYGAQSFLVAPSTIAKAVSRILTDNDYKNELIKNGSENVKKYYKSNNLCYFHNLINQ